MRVYKSENLVSVVDSESLRERNWNLKFLLKCKVFKDERAFLSWKCAYRITQTSGRSKIEPTYSVDTF